MSRLTFTVSLEVDGQAWANEYEPDVPLPVDVRNYLSALIECCTGADFWSDIDVIAVSS